MGWHRERRTLPRSGSGMGGGARRWPVEPSFVGLHRPSDTRRPPSPTRSTAALVGGSRAGPRLRSRTSPRASPRRPRRARSSRLPDGPLSTHPALTRCPTTCSPLPSDARSSFAPIARRTPAPRRPALKDMPRTPSPPPTAHQPRRGPTSRSRRDRERAANRTRGTSARLAAQASAPPALITGATDRRRRRSRSRRASGRACGGSPICRRWRATKSTSMPKPGRPPACPTRCELPSASCPARPPPPALVAPPQCSNEDTTRAPGPT